MSNNVGILTMKEFNRIRNAAAKKNKRSAVNDSNEGSKRTNTKSQLSAIPKENEDDFENVASKTLSSKDSKRLQSHIPSLSSTSKSSLSSTSKKKILKEQKPNLAKPENKFNKKSMKNLPPSLINGRNKNNKFSKIPLRQVQTFEDDSNIDDNQSQKFNSSKSTQRAENKIDDENDIELNQETPNNSQLGEELSLNERVNSSKSAYNEPDDISHLQEQKKSFPEMEQLSTMQFQKTNDPFADEDKQDENSVSHYRNNIHKLQIEIESLRSRRKKEVSIFHEKALEQRNKGKYQNLINNNDDDSIDGFKNELMKNETDSLF